MVDALHVDVQRAVGQIDVEYLRDVVQEQHVVGAGDIEAGAEAAGLHAERERDADVAALAGAVSPGRGSSSNEAENIITPLLLIATIPK